MSIELYYFSGTGNSLHVAKELKKNISDIKLIPILSLMDAASIKPVADTLGFVFPQYASTYPKVFGRFLDKLLLESPKYIFAVTTRGGTETTADQDLDKVLNGRGSKLNAFFVINMPGGSSPLVKNCAERLAEERITKLEAGLQQKLKIIQNIILNKKDSRVKDTEATTKAPLWLKPFLPPLLSLAKKLENKFIFYYDSKCTGCGVCKQVCLAGKIDMVKERPIWQAENPCFACWACLNYCPAQSIQVKSKWYVKSYTEVNGRYHHPDVSVAEIARQKNEFTAIIE